MKRHRKIIRMFTIFFEHTTLHTAHKKAVEPEKIFWCAKDMLSVTRAKIATLLPTCTAEQQSIIAAEPEAGGRKD